MDHLFVLGVDLDGVCARLDPCEDPLEVPTRDDRFAEADVVDGAADTLWRLSDAGVWIRILAHRLHVKGAHVRAVAETVVWLDDAHIPYRDLCFLGAKPDVEADLYVDDTPANVIALRRGGNEVIVFDQPYNRDLRDPRAADWAEVEEIVMERFTERSGVYGVQPQLPGVDGALGRRLGRDRPASDA